MIRRNRTACERMARVMIARERKANLRIARKLLRLAKEFLMSDMENVKKQRNSLKKRMPEIVKDLTKAACHGLATQIASNPEHDASSIVTLPVSLPGGSLDLEARVYYDGQEKLIDVCMEVEGNETEECLKQEEIDCSAIATATNNTKKLEDKLVEIITGKITSTTKLFISIQRNHGFPYADEETGELLGKKSEGGEEPGDSFDHLTRNEDDTDETMIGFHDEDDDEYKEEEISKPMRRKKRTYRDRLNEMY